MSENKFHNRLDGIAISHLKVKIIDYPSTVNSRTAI